MPKKTFNIDPEQTESIFMSWGMAWKNTTISFEGNQIGSFKNQKELKQGNEFQLDDTRKIKVKLSGLLHPELDISIDGVPIEGSPTNPYNQLKQLSKFAIILGGLSVIIGLLTEILNIQLLMNLGFGLGAIVVGTIVTALGFWVKKQSYIALSLLILIIFLDIVSVLYFASNSTIDINPTNGILMKVFFIAYFLKGYSAIKKIKNTDHCV
jgi:hypothetical protein